MYLPQVIRVDSKTIVNNLCTTTPSSELTRPARTLNPSTRPLNPHPVLWIPNHLTLGEEEFPYPQPVLLTHLSVGMTGPQRGHCGGVCLFGEALVRSNEAKELWEVLLDDCGASGPDTRPPS